MLFRSNPPLPLNLRLDSSPMHLLDGASASYVLSPRADRSGEIVPIIIEIHDQVERPRTLLTFHELSQWARHISGGVPKKKIDHLFHLPVLPPTRQDPPELLAAYLDATRLHRNRSPYRFHTDAGR